MGLMYWAIDEDNSVVEKYLSDTDKIIKLTSDDIKMTLTQNDFDFFVLSVDDFVDLGNFNQCNFKGIIFVIDPNVLQTSMISNNVYQVKNIREFLKLFINIKKQGHRQDKLLKSENVEHKPSQNQEKENISISSLTNTQVHSNPITIQNTSDISPRHSNEKNKVVYSFEKVNLSPPVLLENGYPKNAHEKRNDEYLGVKEIINRYYQYKKKGITIGIWSPLSSSGEPLHILMNLAIYLAQYTTDITVLETITQFPVLKKKLTKYKSAPKNWVSIMHPRFSNEPFNPETQSARWNFRNVDWLPIDNEMVQATWRASDVKEYLNALNYSNIGFVLLPEGIMKYQTKYVLSELDELWIMLDNRFTDAWEWKTLLQDLCNYYNFKIGIVFYDSFDDKRAKRIAKELNFDLISIFPNIHAYTQMNEIEEFPIIDKMEVLEILEPGFRKIKNYLLGEKKGKTKRKSRIFKLITNVFNSKID